MRTKASVSLREAGAAKARTGVQELAPDPAVESNAASDIMHIGADLLAQIGHFVDEGDLHGQECIGCVFSQFGRIDPGEHYRRFDKVRGR
jgi:hypothetical protein